MFYLFEKDKKLVDNLKVKWYYKTPPHKQRVDRASKKEKENEKKAWLERERMIWYMSCVSEQRCKTSFEPWQINSNATLKIQKNISEEQSFLRKQEQPKNSKCEIGSAEDTTEKNQLEVDSGPSDQH